MHNIANNWKQYISSFIHIVFCICCFVSGPLWCHNKGAHSLWRQELGHTKITQHILKQKKTNVPSQNFEIDILS